MKKIELNAEDKRIHVGLSWEYLYGEDGNKHFEKLELLKMKFKDFPKTKTFVIYFLFIALLSYTFYDITKFYDLSIYNLAIIIIIGTLIFLFFLNIYISMPGAFLRMGAKKIDRKYRDRKFRHYDIDLHCFVFDSNKNFLFEISPEPTKLVSTDISIYHSGEVVDGLGSYDDESISLHIKKIPDNQKYFLFCVSNDCKHDFDKVLGLKIRLALTQRNQTIIESLIKSSENDGFVFCLLTKLNEEWYYEDVNQYTPFHEDWHKDLQKLI